MRCEAERGGAAHVEDVAGVVVADARLAAEGRAGGVGVRREGSRWQKHTPTKGERAELKRT